MNICSRCGGAIPKAGEVSEWGGAWCACQMTNNTLIAKNPNRRYDWQLRKLLGAGFTDDQADAIIEILEDLE